MAAGRVKVALTGFMGVGKSSVARHIGNLLDSRRVDLDNLIEKVEGRKIADIIDREGLEYYRRIETSCLSRALADGATVVVSLGGGAWTIPENRELLKAHGFTCIWLESTFEHCWRNIRCSRKERPLARNKRDARKLFEERQKDYCLAEYHFVIKPELTPFDVAKQIIEEIFGPQR